MNVRSLKEYKQTVIHQAVVRGNFPMMKKYMLLAHDTDPYYLAHGCPAFRDSQ